MPVSSFAPSSCVPSILLIKILSLIAFGDILDSFILLSAKISGIIVLFKVGLSCIKKGKFTFSILWKASKASIFEFVHKYFSSGVEFTILANFARGIIMFLDFIRSEERRVG